jgi:hypothetical protein
MMKQPPMQCVTETISSAAEQSEREADHLLPSNAGVKNERSYIPTSLYALTARTGTMLCNFYIIVPDKHHSLFIPSTIYR